MSTLSPSEKNGAVWSISSDCVSSKYEKCRNITEEIYKRIDITFQIKKLETCTQSDGSDQSDQIDSNDLSNETDLFACDKDSISSSEAERPLNSCEKYININNNEETKKKLPVYKRPRKRFRKRVKKHQPKPPPTDTECSSDEAAPLARVSIDNTSPRRIYLELKPKPHIEKRSLRDLLQKEDTFVPKGKDDIGKGAKLTEKAANVEKGANIVEKGLNVAEKGANVGEKGADVLEKGAIEVEKGANEVKGEIVVPKEQGGTTCDICCLTFKGERALRRHITMSHQVKKGKEKSNKTQQRNSTLD